MSSRRRAGFHGAAQVLIVCAVSVVAAGISAELSLLAFEVESEPVMLLDARSTSKGSPTAQAPRKTPAATRPRRRTPTAYPRPQRELRTGVQQTRAARLRP